VVWKPSEKTLLTALATQAIASRAAQRFGGVPDGLIEVLLGDREIGEILVEDRRVPVLSATGSTAMGRQVAPKLADRFARAILELGGNNAAIVAPSADLDLALRGVAFAAVGTAGQRCTTLRRLFVHESIYDRLVPRLRKVYSSVKIGDPRAEGVLVGPLIDKAAFDGMERALDEARALGGKVHGGGRYTEGPCANGYYAKPALVEMREQTGPVLRETFAPILYVIPYSSFDEVVDAHWPVLVDLHPRHA
jgi:aldehyde dehydrogenase (NAD+)